MLSLLRFFSNRKNDGSAIIKINGNTATGFRISYPMIPNLLPNIIAS